MHIYRRVGWVGIALGALLMVPIATQGAVSSQTELESRPLRPDQLISAAKLYFRDTAEFPMVEKMEFSAFDVVGTLRKRATISVDYVFQGYSPRNTTATASIRGNISVWAVLGGAKTLKASLNGAAMTLIAGSVVSLDVSRYAFEAEDRVAQEGIIIAKLVPKEDCPPFVMSNLPEAYVPDRTCGTMQYQLNSSLHFQKFIYEASGLPVKMRIRPFGESTLQRYRAEVDFQTVVLPGETQPFLVPRQVITELQTSKGRIRISSVYEPKPSGPQKSSFRSQATN